MRWRRKTVSWVSSCFCSSSRVTTFHLIQQNSENRKKRFCYCCTLLFLFILCHLKVLTKGLLSPYAQRHWVSHSSTLSFHTFTRGSCQTQTQPSATQSPSVPQSEADHLNQAFCFLTLQSPSFLWLFSFQTVVTSGFGSSDAGREREQRRRPPAEAEEEVPQPVDPPDQQHRAGSLRPAEGHAGGTGEDSLVYTETNTRQQEERVQRECLISRCRSGSVNSTPSPVCHH